MRIVRTNRQTLFDIALQYCGDAQAVFEIADINDVSLTDMETLTLEVPEPYNKKVAAYYANNNIQPASFEDVDNCIITIAGEPVVSFGGETLIAIMS